MQTTNIAQKHKLSLLQKCSSKIRLLLRSSLSHVPLQLLGQVAGAAECYSNQPNLRLTELLTPIFTRVLTSCFLNVPKNQTIMLPKLPSSLKSDIWIFFTMQLCGHLSYSAHHRHSHSTLLKNACSSLTCYYLSTSNLPLHLPSPASVYFLQKFHENLPIPFRPSPTHPPLSLPSSHQFNSIPPHYSQPPSSLNHTAHPTRNKFPHAFSMQ